MFIPAEFRIDDPHQLASLLAGGAFGTLLTWSGGLSSSAVPVLHTPGEAGGPGRLRGHLALRNPQAAAIRAGEPACLLATLGHAYITPRWYRLEEDVPTWNYVVVEARGRLQPLPAAQTWQLLRDTAALMEPQAEAQGPAWTLEGFSDPALAGHLGRAILGFELELESLVAAAKLSQDKLQGDLDTVRAALCVSTRPGDRQVGELMRALQVRGRAPGSVPSTMPPEAVA